MKLEFYVRDMMCMHCVNRIKEALSVKGIENINIDLESKLEKILAKIQGVGDVNVCISYII